MGKSNKRKLREAAVAALLISESAGAAAAGVGAAGAAAAIVVVTDCSYAAVQQELQLLGVNETAYKLVKDSGAGTHAEYTVKLVPIGAGDAGAKFNPMALACGLGNGMLVLAKTSADLIGNGRLLLILSGTNPFVTGNEARTLAFHQGAVAVVLMPPGADPLAASPAMSAASSVCEYVVVRGGDGGLHSPEGSTTSGATRALLEREGPRGLLYVSSRAIGVPGNWKLMAEYIEWMVGLAGDRAAFKRALRPLQHMSIPDKIRKMLLATLAQLLGPRKTVVKTEALSDSLGEFEGILTLQIAKKLVENARPQTTVIPQVVDHAHCIASIEMAAGRPDRLRPAAVGVQALSRTLAVEHTGAAIKDPNALVAALMAALVELPEFLALLVLHQDGDAPVEVSTIEATSIGASLIPLPESRVMHQIPQLVAAAGAGKAVLVGGREYDIIFMPPSGADFMNYSDDKYQILAAHAFSYICKCLGENVETSAGKVRAIDKMIALLEGVSASSPEYGLWHVVMYAATSSTAIPLDQDLHAFLTNRTVRDSPRVWAVLQAGLGGPENSIQLLYAPELVKQFYPVYAQKFDERFHSEQAAGGRPRLFAMVQRCVLVPGGSKVVLVPLDALLESDFAAVGAPSRKKLYRIKSRMPNVSDRVKLYFEMFAPVLGPRGEKNIVGFRLTDTDIRHYLVEAGVIGVSAEAGSKYPTIEFKNLEARERFLAEYANFAATAAAEAAGPAAGPAPIALGEVAIPAGLKETIVARFGLATYNQLMMMIRAVYESPLAAGTKVPPSDVVDAVVGDIEVRPCAACSQPMLDAGAATCGGGEHRAHPHCLVSMATIGGRTNCPLCNGDMPEATRLMLEGVTGFPPGSQGYFMCVVCCRANPRNDPLEGEGAAGEGEGAPPCSVGEAVRQNTCADCVKAAALAAARLTRQDLLNAGIHDSAVILCPGGHIVHCPHDGSCANKYCAQCAAEGLGYSHFCNSRDCSWEERRATASATSGPVYDHLSECHGGYDCDQGIHLGGVTREEIERGQLDASPEADAALARIFDALDASRAA